MIGMVQLLIFQTYIILANYHDVVLGYPDAARGFDKSKRRVAHDFSVHVADSRAPSQVSNDQSAAH
jgi:hypothetical protein